MPSKDDPTDIGGKFYTLLERDIHWGRLVSSSMAKHHYLASSIL